MPATHGKTVFYLIVGKNGTQCLAPVYHHIILICQTILLQNILLFSLSECIPLRCGEMRQFVRKGSIALASVQGEVLFEL